MSFRKKTLLIVVVPVLCVCCRFNNKVSESGAKKSPEGKVGSFALDEGEGGSIYEYRDSQYTCSVPATMSASLLLKQTVALEIVDRGEQTGQSQDRRYTGTEVIEIYCHCEFDPSLTHDCTAPWSFDSEYSDCDRPTIVEVTVDTNPNVADGNELGIMHTHLANQRASRLASFSNPPNQVDCNARCRTHYSSIPAAEIQSGRCRKFKAVPSSLPSSTPIPSQTPMPNQSSLPTQTPEPSQTSMATSMPTSSPEPTLPPMPTGTDFP